MIFEIGAAFHPESDQVQLQYSVTDNLGTPLPSDWVEATLFLVTEDSFGTKARHAISTLYASSEYARADRSFLLTFRHPRVRESLEIDVNASVQSTPHSETVLVGNGGEIKQDMDLPDNEIFEDPFKERHDTDPSDFFVEKPENSNSVVLAPEIRSLITRYPFSESVPPEQFATFGFAGGGNRLLPLIGSGALELQGANVAPWSIGAFTFLEPATQNLLPNAFFITTTPAGEPVGYLVDSGGSLLTQSVEIDSRTSATAKIWKARFRQVNTVSAFNFATISHATPVVVLPGDPYVFSTLVRVRRMTQQTVVRNVTLEIDWIDVGDAVLSTTTQQYDTQDYTTLGLALVQGVAPIGAVKARARVRLHQIDPGDDIELTLMAPQLEQGEQATSRTDSIRQADMLTYPDYQVTDHKWRAEMIVGFASGTPKILAQTPDLTVELTGTSTLRATITGQATVEAPVVFAVGDLIDLGVRHLAGNTLSIYWSGQEIASVPLPGFAAAPATLNFLGVGAELVALTIFSRA